MTAGSHTVAISGSSPAKRVSQRPPSAVMAPPTMIGQALTATIREPPDEARQHGTDRRHRGEEQAGRPGALAPHLAEEEHVAEEHREEADAVGERRDVRPAERAVLEQARSRIGLTTRCDRRTTIQPTPAANRDQRPHARGWTSPTARSARCRAPTSADGDHDPDRAERIRDRAGVRGHATPRSPGAPTPPRGR